MHVLYRQFFIGTIQFHMEVYMFFHSRCSIFGLQLHKQHYQLKLLHAIQLMSNRKNQDYQQRFIPIAHILIHVLLQLQFFMKILRIEVWMSNLDNKCHTTMKTLIITNSLQVYLTFLSFGFSQGRLTSVLFASVLSLMARPSSIWLILSQGWMKALCS